MIVRVLLGLLCLIVSTWAQLDDPALGEEKAVFVLPVRPAGHVCDPSKWLSDAERSQWESQLQQWQLDEQIEVFLVILPTLHSTPPDFVAKELGQSWGNKKLHGIVLFVPGTAGPTLYWGGETSDAVALDPRAKKGMVGGMERRVSSEMSAREQISSAANELITTMRLLKAQWKQILLVRQKFDETIFAKASEQKFQKRLYLAIAGVILMIVLPLLFWGIRLWRRKNRVYLFPQISSQRRFGALYAGGSGASLNLSVQRNRSKKRKRS